MWSGIWPPSKPLIGNARTALLALLATASGLALAGADTTRQRAYLRLAVRLHYRGFHSVSLSCTRFRCVSRFKNKVLSPCGRGYGDRAGSLAGVGEGLHPAPSHRFAAGTISRMVRGAVTYPITCDHVLHGADHATHFEGVSSSSTHTCCILSRPRPMQRLALVGLVRRIGESRSA
jgi:hypothetical protein